MAIEKFTLEFINRKNISADVQHISFKRTDGLKLSYNAGQFITLLFNDENNNIKRRSYSIVNFFGESDTIDIAVSYVKNGIASECLFNMDLGYTISAMGPAGRLVLKDDNFEPEKRIILMGTGTGIAPYRCMLPILSEKLKSSPTSRVDILFGVKKRNDAIYIKDFNDFTSKHSNSGFTMCFSREAEIHNDYEFTGYVQKKLKDMSLDPAQDTIYLCGNPQMIDDTYAILVELGFDSKNVKREKYISSN